MCGISLGGLMRLRTSPTHRMDVFLGRTGVHRRLIKWTFFVFHFRRRRRPKSDDLVLLGSRSLLTMALLL